MELCEIASENHSVHCYCYCYHRLLFQASKSNMTTVVLAPLYFTSSGEYRCEGSTVPPLHRSLAISKTMNVVGK